VRRILVRRQKGGGVAEGKNFWGRHVLKRLSELFGGEKRKNNFDAGRIYNSIVCEKGSGTKMWDRKKTPDERKLHLKDKKG